MSFQQIDELTQDPVFNGRVRACAVQQAETFKDDARPDFVSLANDQLVGGTTYLAFVRIIAAFPGLADADEVADGDILSQMQANWPVVAGLYFNDDGSPKT
jgi:hypothetical protein